MTNKNVEENNIHSYDDYPSVLHAEDIQIILRMGRRKTYEFLSDPPFHVNRVGKLIKVSKEGVCKIYCVNSQTH